MSHLVLEHVTKIFGERPHAVLPQVRDGIAKERLLEQSGHVIGVRDVSLEIQAGETFVVMGLSGSGKSTLIRHLNRLIEPTDGRILLDGDDILRLNAAGLRNLRRRRMSMVFQRFGLLPHKTVRDNVASGLRISGTSKQAALAQAEEQIEAVGLAGFEDRYPSELSGGMQQRVGLARALATEADILLMDEAFSALDPLIRSDMQQQLMELQQRYHKTIVFITHDLDEALRLGDHVAILKDGELRQVGTSEDILLRPADDYVRRFVMDVNRSRVVTMRSVMEPAKVLRQTELTHAACAELLGDSAHAHVVVVDAERRPVGLLSAEATSCATSDLAAQLRVPTCLDEHSTIDDAVPHALQSSYPLCVTNAQGQLVGMVSPRHLLRGIVGASGRPN